VSGELYTRDELFAMGRPSIGNPRVRASLLALMPEEERVREFNLIRPPLNEQVRQMLERAGITLPKSPGPVWEKIVALDVDKLCREGEQKCVARLQEYLGVSNVTESTLFEMRHVCEELLREHSPNFPLELYLARHPNEPTSIQIAVSPKR